MYAFGVLTSSVSIFFIWVSSNSYQTSSLPFPRVQYCPKFAVPLWHITANRSYMTSSALVGSGRISNAKYWPIESPAVGYHTSTSSLVMPNSPNRFSFMTKILGTLYNSGVTWASANTLHYRQWYPGERCGFRCRSKHGYIDVGTWLLKSMSRHTWKQKSNLCFVIWQF